MTRITNSVLEERRQRSLEAYAAASKTDRNASSSKDVYVHDIPETVFYR